MDLIKFYINSPQVNGILISSVTNLVYELPYELEISNFRRKLGTVGKISNLARNILSTQFFFKKLTCGSSKKHTQVNAKLLLSCLILLHQSIFSKYFVRD